MKLISLQGKTFGRLSVRGQAPRTYQTMWHCICTCGKETVVSGINLTTGHTNSCGCLSDEVRLKNSLKRDFTGAKNPKSKVSRAKHGALYVPSTSVWYHRAAGVYYTAKKNNIPLGFASVSEMAAYIMSIAPSKCPVFDKRFTSKGNGFSVWSPSIDKIDPKKGYVKGNIQVISMLANCMKRNATPKQLRTFAEWVLKEK